MAVDDPDVEVVGEQRDPGAGVEPADADVVEAAVVSQGDGACLIDTVVPDAAVRIDVGAAACGLGSGCVGLTG